MVPETWHPTGACTHLQVTNTAISQWLPTLRCSPGRGRPSLIVDRPRQKPTKNLHCSEPAVEKSSPRTTALCAYTDTLPPLFVNLHPSHLVHVDSTTNHHDEGRSEFLLSPRALLAASIPVQPSHAPYSEAFSSQTPPLSIKQPSLSLGRWLTTVCRL